MKIGNRTVIYNESFIVSRGELIEIDVMVADKIVNFIINFIEDSSRDPVSWKVDGLKIIMTFSNWAARSSLVTATLKIPFKIGIINNVPFGFQVACNVSGDIYIGNLIFMSGGTYDE